jgi:hypothetical protein
MFQERCRVDKIKYTDNPRYKDQPLLRLLELYALHHIGRLSAEDEAGLKAMAPKLRATWGLQGEWHEVVAAAVKLPAGFPDHIRRLWEHERDEVAPEQFVRAVIDANVKHKPG